MPEAVQVWFPILGAGAAEIGWVSCRRNGARITRDQIIEIFNKPNPNISVEVPQVIAAARANIIEGAGEPILLRFDGKPFSDNSYQLALAISDRLLLSAQLPRVVRRIFATGAIRCDGDGQIDPVDGLFEKLQIVFESVDAGDVLILPTANRVSWDDNCETLFEHLREQKGILVFAASHLDELGFLWIARQERTARPEENRTIPNDVEPPADPHRTKAHHKYLQSFAVGVILVVIYAIAVTLI